MKLPSSIFSLFGGFGFGNEYKSRSSKSSNFGIGKKLKIFSPPLLNKVREFEISIFGGSWVQSSVSKCDARFKKFEVRSCLGSGGSKFGIFEFVPALLILIIL